MCTSIYAFYVTQNQSTHNLFSLLLFAHFHTQFPLECKSSSRAILVITGYFMFMSPSHKPLSYHVWFMGPQLMWRADICYIMRWLMHKMKHDIRKRSLPNATKNYKSLYHAGRRLLNVLVLLHFSTNGTILLLPYWSELFNINYNGWDHKITEWLMLKLDPLMIENDTYYFIDTSWRNTEGGKLQSMRHVSH